MHDHVRNANRIDKTNVHIHVKIHEHVRNANQNDNSNVQCGIECMVMRASHDILRFSFKESKSCIDTNTWSAHATSSCTMH